MQNHTYSSDIVCLNTPEIAPPSGHYSHVCTAGGFVFISGQLPLDNSGLPLRDEPFEAQAQRVLHNIDACLKVVRCARTDLVQVRVYVACISNWAAFNKVYGDWIGEHRPARPLRCTTVWRWKSKLWRYSVRNRQCRSSSPPGRWLARLFRTSRRPACHSCPRLHKFVHLNDNIF